MIEVGEFELEVPRRGRSARHADEHRLPLLDRHSCLDAPVRLRVPCRQHGQRIAGIEHLQVQTAHDVGTRSQRRIKRTGSPGRQQIVGPIAQMERPCLNGMDDGPQIGRQRLHVKRVPRRGCRGRGFCDENARDDMDQVRLSGLAREDKLLNAWARCGRPCRQTRHPARIPQLEAQGSRRSGRCGRDGQVARGGGLEAEPVFVAGGNRQLGNVVLDDRSQVGRCFRRVVGLEPVVGGIRGRADRLAREEDVLVAVAGVGPGGVNRLVRDGQAEGIAQVIIRLTCRVGESACVSVEGLVGDAEVGAEGQAAIGADRAEDIEEVVLWVAAGVVPDHGDVALGVHGQPGQRLVGNHVIWIQASGGLAVVVIVQDVGCARAHQKGALPGHTVVDGAGKDDVGADVDVVASGVGDQVRLGGVDCPRSGRVSRNGPDRVCPELVRGLADET